MAKLSAKVVKPISIKITTDNVIVSYEDSSKKYELNEKIKLDGEHYGFTLIKSIDEFEYGETYPTQGRVSNIELNNGMLNVYEYGKYNPWKFNNDGQILENPTFKSIYSIEIEYPINIDTKSINVYVKK